MHDKPKDADVDCAHITTGDEDARNRAQVLLLHPPRCGFSQRNVWNELMPGGFGLLRPGLGPANSKSNRSLHSSSAKCRPSMRISADRQLLHGEAATLIGRIGGMPERPREHKVGERDRSAVEGVLADAEHAVSEVSRDYGEDLLVQTDHKGHMDASRLWVQVKGTDDVTRYRTSKKSRKDRFSLSVPFETAIRWIRTIDLAIVVLWDIEKKTGWYAVPRRQVDVWKGTMSGQKT